MLNHTTSLQKISIIALLWSLSSFAAAAQDGREILEGYLKKVSGDSIGRWDLVRSAYTETFIEFSDPAQGSTPSLGGRKPSFHKFYWVYPDKAKDEIYNDSILSSSLFNVKDHHFMVMGTMEPKPVARMPDFEFEPTRIRKMLMSAKAITYLGVKNFPTGDCHHLEISTKKASRHVYIHVDTFFMDYSGDIKGEAAEDFTRYFNYKKTDNNLWYPMSTTSSKNGNIYFSVNTQKIKLNLDIPDSVFTYHRK